MTPCLVITRDRVSYTRLCVAAIEQHPDLDIHLVDHGSTWPPMVDYLLASAHPVHWRGDHPPRALWEWDGLRRIVGDDRRYLVTDPDVVLACPPCPPDWLERLGGELDRADVVKVGLGLRLDDLPDGELATKVRAWEGAFRLSRRASGAWSAPVDTTLALYPALAVQSEFWLGPAARLDEPYVVRHLPWYGPLDPDEDGYYRDRLVPGSSHWVNGGW